MKELAILSLLALAGCASDGSFRYETRLPLGSDAKYGTLLVGVGYLPPEQFASVLNQPTLRDK